MFESEHVKNIESLASVMASRREKNKEKREKIAHLAGILVSQRQQDHHGIPHVHPSIHCSDLSNSVAPPEHTVCTQQSENQGKASCEGQLLVFKSPGLSNSVAPPEHTVCTQQLENQGVLGEGQLVFKGPELSNGVAPLENTVCTQNAETQAKEKSHSIHGEIPMDHNATITTEQMLDCLPVEDIWQRRKTTAWMKSRPQNRISQ